MFSSEMYMLKPTDGRYNNEMESMDMMLTYENNELMSSDFFDTIRSVENEIHDDFLLNTSVDDFLTTSSETDGFLTSSETSSNVDGSISPRNDASESGSIYNDESVSPSGLVEPIDDSLLEFLTPIKNDFTLKQEQTPSAPVILKTIKPSRIIIQNPNNNKIINKQIINPGQLKKITKKQILKVQPITSNGKVLLPCGLKNIKILNVNDLKTERIHVASMPQTIRKVNNKVTETANSPHTNKTLNEVKLTAEEKRLLEKEGIQLPAYHPLTKMEDRELKRIRRKIRNKISAQDSRKRKKEYVDGLEEKVRRGSEENRNLMQRIKELQKKNRTLMAHISKLQSLLFNTSSSKATPSTCLMIVMLSALLVSLPNINLNGKTNNDIALNEEEAFSISRSLLSTKKDDSINMEEFIAFNKDDEIRMEEENETSSENEFYKTIENFENKYNFDENDDNFFKALLRNVKNLFNGSNDNSFVSNKGYLEPDIDEYEPEPAIKRMKLIDDYHQNDENFVPVVSVPKNILSESKEK